PPIADNPDPARMDRARALANQNRCNFCHQSKYQGQENVPRLAGQREDYLLKALRGYKDNSRHGYDAQMSEVVYTMKDEDFVDLAYFLARQWHPLSHVPGDWVWNAGTAAATVPLSGD